MTAIPWLRIRSFMYIYSVIRVGKDACYCLFVEALRWMARMGTPWRAWPPEYGRELGLWSLCGLVQPRRLAAPAGPRPSGSVRRAAGQHGRARARARPKRKRRNPLWAVAGAAHPDPHPGGSTGSSPVRDGRPTPRQHPSPDPRGSLDRPPLPCLIADRAYDRDAFRVWLAQRDIEAIIPARRRRTNPQPHDPERY